MTTLFRYTGSVALALLVGACAVPVQIGGHTDDYAEIISGTAQIDPLTGGGPAVIVAERTKIRCEGMVVNYLNAGGPGSRARATLTCNDGRRLEADMLQTSFSGGTGTGQDEFGNSASFVWDMNDALVRTVLDKDRAEVNRRGLAVDHILRKVAAPIAAPAVPAVPVAAPMPNAAIHMVRFKPGPERPDDIAVIIGNANYSRLGRDIPDVKPAHADAEGMRAYATQALGVRDGNVILLKDATGAQMTRVFGSDKDHRGQLFDWVKPGQSRVFVYYSGHGAPGTRGDGPYLIPTDADAARVELNGYPLPQLYANLAKLPAESVTLVLESCFSGVSQAGSVLKNASPVYVKPKVPSVPPRLTVITAGAADQVASWEPDGSYGLFTRNFLDGMAGKADANKDGTVGLDELDRYLADTLTYYARRHYGRDQRAQIVRGGGK